MTSSNRKLMMATARDLTARADPQGVEKYVAGLSTERPSVYARQKTETNHERGREQKVHKMQNGGRTKIKKPERYNPKIDVIDMEKGVANFFYGRLLDFEDMDRKDEMLEEQGYEITSVRYALDREKGITYIINFEPRDLVA